MNSKKVVILLHALLEPNIEVLKESLLICCKDNNLTVIETIIADDEYDCQVLSKVIKLINSANDPIHLIISDNSFNEISYIFTYTFIAALLEAKLISSLYIYQNEISNGGELLEVKKGLLPFCAEYYKAMILLIE